jgi:hypothetical protein
VQAKPIPFEDGERFQCNRIDLKVMARYLNAKHSGLYKEILEYTKLAGLEHCNAFALGTTSKVLGCISLFSHELILAEAQFPADRKITGDQARRIAEAWKGWRGLASFYLIMAERIGLEI